MAGLIDTLTRLSSPWAYVVVGLLATAEAVFVGLVLPGELALLLGGFLAYQGRHGRRRRGGGGGWLRARL